MYLTSLAAELVERQFVHCEPDTGGEVEEPVPQRRGLWRSRATLADLLARAARSVAPSGYDAAV